MNARIVTVFAHCTEFQWDDGNTNKNWISHRVSRFECEEVFFNEPILLFDDHKHSEFETRYYMLGKTKHDRKLFVVFTIRSKKIRVISARDMSRRERIIYDEAQKDTEI